MPRPKLIPQSEFPYSISGRCVNKEWFSQPLDEVWEIMCERLHYIHHLYGVRIIAFVLMSNHFHLIMLTPRLNVSEAMGCFMRETGRGLRLPSQRINYTYGKRHFKTILGSYHYFLHSYKYLYMNPVKAGLANCVEEYPYSTLSGLLGFRRCIIPVEEDLTLFSDVEGTLNWLNRPVKDSDWIAVKRALRRREFWLAKEEKRPHHLEIDSL